MDHQKTENGGLKKALGELCPAFALTLAFCFMLFIYEPLLMYCVNIDDFWFDIYMILPAVFGWFGIFFGGSSLIMALVYLLDRKLLKKPEPKLFYVVTLAVFLLFVTIYSQGNVFAGSLPALDGGEIDWDSLRVHDIPMFAVFAVFLVVIIIAGKKMGLKKMMKITAFGSGLLFAMLLVSLIVQIISWNAFKRKDSIITTTDHFETISENKNFIIFLTDAVASVDFGKVLENDPGYEEVFEDFTYYPDTLGCYPCTRDSLPVILAGALNRNEKEFADFASEAYNASPFFAQLDRQKYDITLYDADFVWYGSKKHSVINGVEYKGYHMKFTDYMGQAKKYILYKYLPYNIKSISDIESFNLNYLVDKYIWDDHTIYHSILDNPTLKKTSDNQFKYIHAEGAHIPFDYDENLNIIDSGGTYRMKIRATITMLDAYLKRLKENGAYDNSVIIIMADHGNTNLNSSDDMFIRGNPMFMVKGFNEHHSFASSDKPLSYLDLMDAYDRLLDGCTAEETFADIPETRERIFMWYRNFRLENHMVEYVVTDKAWKWAKFKETGNVYDLH